MSDVKSFETIDKIADEFQKVFPEVIKKEIILCIW